MGSAQGRTDGKMFPCKGEVHGIKPCSNPTAFNESLVTERGELRINKGMRRGGREVSQIFKFLLGKMLVHKINH